jgi:hypothetical protein
MKERKKRTKREYRQIMEGKTDMTARKKHTNEHPPSVMAQMRRSV